MVFPHNIIFFWLDIRTGPTLHNKQGTNCLAFIFWKILEKNYLIYSLNVWFNLSMNPCGLGVIHSMRLLIIDSFSFLLTYSFLHITMYNWVVIASLFLLNLFTKFLMLECLEAQSLSLSLHYVWSFLPDFFCSHGCKCQGLMFAKVCP